MVAMLLGLPAFCLLVVYIYVKLRSRNNITSGAPGTRSLALIEPAICRAGAIALSIGFIFNSGLFYIPICVPFWILLELGAGDFNAIDFDPKRNRREMGLIISVAAGLVLLLLYSHKTDRFYRTEFSVTSGDGVHLDCMSVRRSVLFTNEPTLVYLHSSGESLAQDGCVLRQLAELRFRAISCEYNQTNKYVCIQQLAALSKYLKEHSTFYGSSICWIGNALGAQSLLDAELTRGTIDSRLSIFLSCEKPYKNIEMDSVTNMLGFMDDSPSSPRGANAFESVANPFMLFVQGQNDDIFTPKQVESIAKTLRLYGITAFTTDVAGVGHDLDPDSSLIIRLVGELCKQIVIPNGVSEPISSKVSIRELILCFFTFALIISIWSTIDGNINSYLQTILRYFIYFYKRRKTFIMFVTTVLISLFAVCVIATQLEANGVDVYIVSKTLVPPSQRNAFMHLASITLSEGNSLYTLLNYFKLANYDRSLSNWKLKDNDFDDFVLSPCLDNKQQMQLCWRQHLWELLYPRIKHVQTEEQAATIIVRYLRERITITTEAKRPTEYDLVDIFNSQLIDKNGFSMIYVAALRSVGIPAKLNDSGQALFFYKNSWTIAPEPDILSLCPCVLPKP